MADQLVKLEGLGSRHAAARHDPADGGLDVAGWGRALEDSTRGRLVPAVIALDHVLSEISRPPTIGRPQRARHGVGCVVHGGNVSTPLRRRGRAGFVKGTEPDSLPNLRTSEKSVHGVASRGALVGIAMTPYENCDIASTQSKLIL